jgi:phosphoglycolate phosphatase
MIVLFDIDGTLVSVKGAGRRALTEAIEMVTGVANALEGVRLHGGTDLGILRQAGDLHLGRELGQEEIEEVFKDYLVRLESYLDASGEDYLVLPGVRDILHALCETGQHVIGLATGNLEAAAKIKLRPAGLDTFFEFGGYGSDAAHRPDLVQKGVDRGQTLMQAEFSKTAQPEQIFVIGDTERDVSAAHEVGVMAVGVLAGSTCEPALRAAQPDLLVDSLADPSLWRLLGLQSTL